VFLFSASFDRLLPKLAKSVSVGLYFRRSYAGRVKAVKMRLKVSPSTRRSYIVLAE